MASGEKKEITCFVEEETFINDKGEEIKFLRLGIPCADDVVKYVKVEKFVLQMAMKYAEEQY